MSRNDRAAQEHIEFLEAQLIVLEIENQELRDLVDSLKVLIHQYQSDREMVLKGDVV